MKARGSTCTAAPAGSARPQSPPASSRSVTGSTSTRPSTTCRNTSPRPTRSPISARTCGAGGTAAAASPELLGGAQERQRQRLRGAQLGGLIDLGLELAGTDAAGVQGDMLEL